MPPTAESVLLQRRPISGQSKLTSQFVPHKPLSGRPTSSHQTLLRESDRMRMNMAAEKHLLASDSDIRFQFFHKEPCLYSHQIYINAGKIFTALKHDSLEEKENPYLKRKNKDAMTKKIQGIPQLTFENDKEKRLAFELAFATLKYQLLFEEILQDCAFYSLYPEFVEDHGLVMVMLCDFQGRKFQQRTPLPEETIAEDVQQIEDAILECKTRLNASVARRRIKAEAPSLDHLLPEIVRSKEELRSSMPVYGWVNQKKISISELIECLKDDRFKLVSSDETIEGKKFCVDSLCNDVLMFSPECITDLMQSELVTAGKLVLQDKSSSIAPHSVKYLVSDENDVIHVNVGSGMTTAHLGSLMQERSGHIWAFGAKNVNQVRENMDKLGIKGVKVLNENFLDVEPDDNRFKNAKVILITADCSKSGIANPIDFIVTEGEDMKILKDLSVGDTDLSKLGDLTIQHTDILKHALKFSKVQAVVYTTRSVHESENENVVTKAVEYINLVQHRKFPYRVVPPVLPFTSEAIDNKFGIHGKFIKFKPTDKTNGCFIAVVTREPEDSKEAARDVLARAQARGLLSGKKLKTKMQDEQQNGEEPVISLSNGHTKSEKLLSKRSKKSEQRLPVRGTVSSPHAGYSKPHPSSPIHTYIHTPLKSRPQNGVPRTSNLSVGARLYNQSMIKKEIPVPKRDRPLVSEHMKVVKHPAPFRHKKRKTTKKGKP